MIGMTAKFGSFFGEGVTDTIKELGLIVDESTDCELATHSRTSPFVDMTVNVLMGDLQYHT